MFSTVETRLASIVERNTRCLVQKLSACLTSCLDGAGTLSHKVCSVAVLSTPRGLVGPVVTAGSPYNQDALVVVCFGEREGLVCRFNAIALSKYFSLNKVDILVTKITWRKYRITILVSVDSENYVSTVQVEKVVGERAHGADVRFLH